MKLNHIKKLSQGNKNKNITLLIKSYDSFLIDNYIKLISNSNKNNIFLDTTNLPLNKSKYTVLRSPHIFNKSREHYISKTYKSQVNIIVKDYNDSFNRFYLQLLSGLEIKFKINTFV